jgi:hypothetical protein
MESRQKQSICGNLGWDNFLEGRICTGWFDLRQDDILNKKLKCSAGKWMKTDHSPTMDILECYSTPQNKEWKKSDIINNIGVCAHRSR